MLNNGTGVLAYVDAARNAYQADVVMLMTYEPDDDLCGIANLPSFYEEWDEEAFGVVSGECYLAGDMTFVHELGHIMGAQHDWYAYQDFMIGGTEPPLENYAHGYTLMPEGLMTVMAYRDECIDKGGLVCARVPWFSDGAMFGQPEGSARPADNARMLSERLWAVANYR